MPKFLVCYDYGMGGVWLYVEARSAAEIVEQYPALTVFEEPPAWWDAEREQRTRAAVGPVWDDWLARLADEPGLEKT